MRQMLVKLMLILAMVGVLVGSVGCETWKGAGRDVQSLGGKMEGDGQ